MNFYKSPNQITIGGDYWQAFISIVGTWYNYKKHVHEKGGYIILAFCKIGVSIYWSKTKITWL